MPFGNPVVGGNGALVRESIQSREYDPGAEGWSINRDGTAEFANAILRGDLQVGPDAPEPRIIVTDQIPPDLANWDTDYQWSSVILMYFNATDFWFQAVGVEVTASPDSPVQATGIYTDAGGLFFQQFTDIQHYLELRFGDVSAYQRFIYRNLQLEFSEADDSKIYVGSGGIVTSSQASYGVTANSDSTTTGPVTWAVMNQTPLNLHKEYQYGDTDVFVQMTVGFYVSNSDTGIDIGVRTTDGGGAVVDWLIGSLGPTTPVLQHIQVSGFRNLNGLEKGGITIQPIWRRRAGTGTISRDNADSFSIEAREVDG